MGTDCAPICKIAMSKIFHSVRLVVEIIPILSFFLIPKSIKAFETAKAWSR